MVVATSGAPRHRPTGPRDEKMRFARTCYDHLAGRLGVGLTESLVEKGYVQADDEAFHLTPSGEKALAKFGLDVAALRKNRRAFASRCLDWSERTPHMGGALGAALLAQLEARKWVSRKKDSRTVEVTREGHRGLQKEFGLSLDD